MNLWPTAVTCAVFSGVNAGLAMRHESLDGASVQAGLAIALGLLSFVFALHRGRSPR